MGTRSWSKEVKYNVGESVHVKASHFDKKGSENKYSDFFPNKENTLLEGHIVSIHNGSIRVKFLLDDTTSQIKNDQIVKITDQNKDLIYSGKTIIVFLQLLTTKS